MSSKKDALLNRQPEVTTYDLTQEEIVEVASLIALEEQAQAARNFIYSRIVQNIAERHGIAGDNVSLNFEEIMEQGAKVAKLVVTN